MNEKAKDALMKAVMGGTYRKVVSAFNKHKLILDDSYFDYQLLRMALQRGHEEIANFLMMHGCRVKNLPSTSREDSALHLVVKNFVQDLHELVDELVGKGASLDAKDSSGSTPLQAAFKQGNIEAIEALLHYCRVDLNPSNKDDIIHFQIACVANHPAVRRFLKCGFDPNRPFLLESENFAGMTPVHFAIKKHDFAQFQLFLQGNNIDLTVKSNSGLTALHMIYYSDHENLMQWFEIAFKHGNFRILNNHQDKSRLSIFHLCCMANEQNLVRTFIESGVSVNRPISVKSPSHAGYTPLHFAVKYGSEGVIKILLENGSDPNKKDWYGATPLHLACEEPDNFTNDIIQLLLEYKADPISVDKTGSTPLHKLVYDVPCEYFLIFHQLITQMEWGSINHTNDQGLSLFHVACATNHIDQVTRFLDAGVHIDSCPTSGPYSGYTALHFAVMYTNKEVVRELLLRNANVNARTLDRYAPIHIACEIKIDQEVIWLKYNRDSDQQEIIRLLLSHGADANAEDSDGLTPVHHVCEIDDDDALYLSDLSVDSIRKLMLVVGNRISEIFKILNLGGSGINARTAEGWSVLHRLTAYTFSGETSENLIKHLVDSGADINATDSHGLTPLHVAAQRGNRAFVETLLRHNADPNIKCKSSKIPMHLIAEEIIATDWNLNEADVTAILNALIEHGSDVNARDKNERTILHYGALNFNHRIIEILLDHGADVHITDSSGDTCITRLSKNVRRYKRSRSRIHLWGDTFKVFCVHVQKLLALGLPVSQTEKNCIAQLYSRYKIELLENTTILDNTFNKCNHELGRMKNIKIDRYTSLYEILIKSPQELSRYVNNNSLSEIVNDSNVERDFPMYTYLLKLQFKRGLKRNDVLQSADVALAKVLKANLPDACYNGILKYFDDDDIAILKEAAFTKSGAKRKSCDYSDESEVAAKLQKRGNDREMHLQLMRVDYSDNNVIDLTRKCAKN